MSLYPLSYSGCTVAVQWLYGGCTVAVRLSLVRYPLSFNETALLAALSLVHKHYPSKKGPIWGVFGAIWGYMGFRGYAAQLGVFPRNRAKRGQKGAKKGSKRAFWEGYPWCATP